MRKKGKNLGKTRKSRTLMNLKKMGLVMN